MRQAKQADLAEPKIAIPEKLYFKIGEVAKIVGVEPYVLRYWETEFAEIVPPKSRGKQRLYRRKDIEQILSIKHLLYHDKFTIDGARQKLKLVNGRAVQSKAEPMKESGDVDREVAYFRASHIGMSKDFLVGLKRKLEKLIDVLQ